MIYRLKELFDALEATVGKYDIPDSRFVGQTSEMNQECKDLMDFLKSKNHIVVKINARGIETIQHTDIRVLKSMSYGPYIESRYGKLVVPTRVNFL